jgi:tRNA threonylcarbamoyladenosine biosynthesis protein TsaE
MTDLVVSTADDMRGLGRRLADLLRPGDLVVLTGPLGAGKTTLVQGLGEGLGSRQPVRSPTFVIVREHRDGRLPLVHVDAYRLGGVVELDELDIDSPLPSSVVAVEWGEGLVEQLAPDRLELRLTIGAGDVRRVTVSGHGPRWTGIRLDRALRA